MEFRLERLQNSIENCLIKCCPPLYYILCSRNNEHKVLKRISGFVYGLLLGLGFYELIIVDLNFTQDAAYIVGGILCLMLAFGIAFSSQIRCISLLAIPSFSGKAGRGVLKALVLAFIISGPIQNLTNNGKEVVRVFACTTQLTFNLTKTRFELMFKPFAQAIYGMKTDADEIKDTIRSIRDVAAPLAGEFENENEMRKLKEENDYLDNLQEDSLHSKDMDDKYKTKGEILEGKRFEKEYLKKIEMRCQNQFNKASEKCRTMFAGAYDKCYDAVTFVAAWLLCWPMKLTFICNIADAMGGSSRCDPSKDLDAGFGEGYEYLKKSRTTLVENFKGVKIQYHLKKIKELQDVRDAADTAKAVLHDVQVKKSILDEILIILKRILAFVFLKILIDAQKYHDAYLRDIEFDNFYITRYFRKIDARRHAKEQRTLLPLKKIERKKIVDPYNLVPLPKEREQLISQFCKLLLEMITATTFVLLDRLFYEALDLVRRHGKIDYTQIGHHDMMLKVKGTGMIATLLRSIVRGFNVKKRIKIVRSNEMCLPQPKILSNYYMFKIYGTYCLIWIMIYIQAYTQRLRRIICAYFYRKREKKRVLFLYNESLKRRIGFFRHMKKKVKKMAREQRLEDNLNLCAVLRIRYPNNCSCLQYFAMARRKCVICGEPEPRKKSNIPDDFEPCKTPMCYFVHCAECWNDMGKQCLACADSSPENSDEDSDEGFQDID